MRVERLLWLAPLGNRLLTVEEVIHFDYELAMREPTPRQVAERGGAGLGRWLRRLRRQDGRGLGSRGAN